LSARTDRHTRFPLDRQARIAVFASGRGSNLRQLVREFTPEDPQGSVRLVISNRADAAALDFAREEGIPAPFIPWPDRASFERQAQEELERHGIDLICLAGFMRILWAEFVSAWQDRMLNIHASVLPDFPGLDPQRQALEAGVSETGCSVHLVDAGVDSGRVILSRRVRVEEGDTPASLAERILVQEHQAYPEAVRLLLGGGV
jgi:phosphoribosylglycinamide formyltransferase-1